MKKITLAASLALSLGIFNVRAQTSCYDVNGYPQSKNTGGTGAYTLIAGMEENAAQTYHYSGPGKITGVRVYGYTPNFTTGVDLNVKIYNVDASGKPTTTIGSKQTTWNWTDNFNGFKDVSFSSGFAVNSNFAVGVEIANGITSFTQFQVKYNGNGEGKGEDLASLAGTSTGFNWKSAKTTFNKDGDFYIVPKMTNYITADFLPSSKCAAIGSSITFTNNTAMSTDSMFNRISLSKYTGTGHLYSWNFGDGSAVSYLKNPAHTYTAAGVYTVTLTSTIDNWSSGCSNSISKQISVGLSASTSSITNVNCFGTKNGSLTITTIGGATPYSYSINNGDDFTSSPTFTALAASTYTVRVTDASNCVQTVVAVVSQSTAIAFSPLTTTKANCNSADGAIQASANGGSGALQYSINGTVWQSSGLFSTLAAGTYTLWVKDANGCSTSTMVAVNNLDGSKITISSKTNLNCFESNNGTIGATATGGTGVLQYSIDGVTFQTSGNFSGLPAKTYFVTVKDASGCKDIKTVVISEPSKLAFKVTSTPVLCNAGGDGNITINQVTGGTGILSYQVGGLFYQSSNSFSGLSAGVYSVNVKDAFGCIATNTVAVIQPTPINTTPVVTNPTCHNSANGSILAIANGGNPGYSYSIDGTNFYPTGNFEELIAGPYTITIKDMNGCKKSFVSTVTEPSMITSSITIGKSTCGNANGNILVEAAGGSGSGYQYSINGTTWNSTGSFNNLVDSTYNILVKDGSSCNNEFQAVLSNSNGPSINSVSPTNITCNGGNNGTIDVTNVTGGSGTLVYNISTPHRVWQASPTFTALNAGTYIVIVQDGLGCSGSYSVVLTQPVAIVVNANVTNLLCSGSANGSATITAGGGSGTQDYSLDGIVYQSNQTFNNLAAGNYQAFVRDAGGCIGKSPFSITSPSPIQISSVGSLNVTCNGAANGAIYLIAAGGTGTLQYSINGLNYFSTNNFSGLSGGTYTASVKDANGCTKTQTVAISEPSLLNASAVTTSVSCAGGHNGLVALTVSGGSPQYAYDWSNGAYSPNAENLGAGTYSVIVTDQNGCTKTLTTTVNQPSSPLVVNATVGNASTGSTADGSVVTTVTGGTSPYTFSWSNGATSQSISDLLPDTYVATITDLNGCVTSGVYTVGISIGIQNFESSITNVRLYPNPASQTITLESDEANINHVEILNLIGAVVYKGDFTERKVSVSLDGLNEGMYFVRYTINNTLKTKRIDIIK